MKVTVLNECKNTIRFKDLQVGSFFRTPETETLQDAVDRRMVYQKIATTAISNTTSLFKGARFSSLDSNNVIPVEIVEIKMRDA